MSHASSRGPSIHFHRALALAGASLIGIGAAGAAHAQTEAPAAAEQAAESPQGDEIVVTATRRSESVQDTPIAVAVQSGETLEQYNVASFQNLTRLEPSLVVNNQGAAGNQFIIRGIISDIGSTTGLYLDEAPLVGGQAVEGNGDGSPGLRLHDIERIEVLKGPQGTLFGSGSMAGTLRIITNKPKLGRVEGGVIASVSTIKSGDTYLDGDAFVNVPIGSQVAARFVAWGESGGGYIDHRISALGSNSVQYKKNVNDRGVWGGRASLLFEPDPDFSILLMATHQEIKVDDVQSWSLDAGPYISTSPTVAPYHDNYDLYSITGTYDVGIGSITAIGSYGNQETFHPEDSTPTGLGLAGAFHLQPFKTSYATLQNFKDYTAELRFASDFKGPFQIVAGAYYEHDKTNGHAVAIRADDVTGIAPCYSVEACTAQGRRNPGFSSPGVPASDFIYAVDTERTVSQWAVYGQVDFKPIDPLTLTAGIRYFDARIHDYALQVQDIAGPPFLPNWGANGGITTPYVTQDDRAKQNSPSYNFSALYEATPDVSLFARAASGFRIGGTNNAANLAEQAGVTIPKSYDSDDLWSYELGIKAYAIARRMFIDFSIYQMDWSKQQLAATDPSGAFDYTLNAGQTRIRGAELSFTYRAPWGLSLGGGITYTDAKLTKDFDPDVISAGTVGFKGDRLPRVPRWTAAGRAEYEGKLSSSSSFYVGADFNYRGSSHYSFNDLNTFNETLKSYFLLGAQAGVRVGGFDVSVFAENLTDKVAIFGLDASPDGLRVYSPPPRTLGARVRAKF